MEQDAEYSATFLERCRSVTAKRPKTIIDHILKHGQITTEEIQMLYGYNHPPRAARDVKEHGIPLETIPAISSDGRKIAAYRFGKEVAEKVRRFDGRTGLSRRLKDTLISQYGSRCFIYLEDMPEASLQLDHRVPFEVAGESATMSTDEFMLLCASANRAKSWSCEHCENWQNLKRREACLTCYWAFPESYDHIAMKQQRRLDLIWQGPETGDYEWLKGEAARAQMEIAEFAKLILRKPQD